MKIIECARMGCRQLTQPASGLGAVCRCAVLTQAAATHPRICAAQPGSRGGSPWYYSVVTDAQCISGEKRGRRPRGGRRARPQAARRRRHERAAPAAGVPAALTE